MTPTTRSNGLNATRPQRECSRKGGNKGEFASGWPDLGEESEPEEAVNPPRRAKGRKRKGRNEDFVDTDDDSASDSASYAPSEDEDEDSPEVPTTRSTAWRRPQRKRVQPEEGEDDEEDEEDGGEDEEHNGEDAQDDGGDAVDDEDAANDKDAADDGDPLSVENLLMLAESDPTNVLHRLIIREKVDILIIDENDTFSMTFAFAAMRGSFDGIWCSRADESPFMPFDLPRLLDENCVRAQSEHEGCSLCAYNAPAGDWAASLRASINKFSHLDLARFDLNFWAHQLKRACDALPFKIPKQYVWLNPPPAMLRGKEFAYLQSFLFDCSQVQQEGGVVFITLPDEVVEDPINDRFDLHSLKRSSMGLGYQHFEEDAFVGQDCQHHGYHPKEDGNRGWKTHIFVKSSMCSPSPSRLIVKLVNSILPSTPPRPTSTLVMEIEPFDAGSFIAATTTGTDKSPPPPELSQATSALLSPPPSPDTPPRTPRKRPDLQNKAYTDLFEDADRNQDVQMEEAEEHQPRQEDDAVPVTPLLQPSLLPPPASSTPVSGKRKSPRNHGDAPNPAYVTKTSAWNDQCTARNASSQAGPSRMTRGATQSVATPSPSTSRKRKQAERSPSPELSPPPIRRREMSPNEDDEPQEEEMQEDNEEMRDPDPQQEESVERSPSPSPDRELEPLTRLRRGRPSANSTSHASSVTLVPTPTPPPEQPQLRRSLRQRLPRSSRAAGRSQYDSDSDEEEDGQGGGEDLEEDEDDDEREVEQNPFVDDEAKETSTVPPGTYQYGVPRVTSDRFVFI